MQKLKQLTLMGLLIFSTLSCTKEQLCKTLGICDLTSKLVIPVASVLVGTDLSIINTILNIAQSGAECGTEDAPPSDGEHTLQYRADATKSWTSETLPDADKGIMNYSTIKAASEQSKNRLYKTNKSGQYRFVLNADYNLKVKERDDSNNNFTVETRSAGSIENRNNVCYSEIVTVLPNPNIPYDPTKPALIFLGVSDK